MGGKERGDQTQGKHLEKPEVKEARLQLKGAEQACYDEIYGKCSTNFAGDRLGDTTIDLCKKFAQAVHQSSGTPDIADINSIFGNAVLDDPNPDRRLNQLTAQINRELHDLGDGREFCWFKDGNQWKIHFSRTGVRKASVLAEYKYELKHGQHKGYPVTEI